MMGAMNLLRMRTYLVLFGILLLAAFLRLYLLGAVPKGVTHDEMGYIYNAYSIAKTGKNVFGQTLPVFTWMTRGGFPFMPVAVYSLVPVFWLLPLTPFAARLLPALMGVFDVWLLFFIVRSLWKDTTLALASALFLAISPWHLHFSRSAYDANFALFWFLSGIALFLRDVARRKTPILWAGAFTAAVYSYRGMSLIFLPLAAAMYWYWHTVHGTAASRQRLGFIAAAGVALLLFLLPVIMIGKSYTAEGMALLSNERMQTDVDTAIRQAQGPLVLRRLFINKPNYIVTRFRENYLKAYSPEFLFLYTEPSIIYSIWSRGRLYIADLFFILIGIWYMLRTKRRPGVLWLTFLAVGGLPGGIGGLPYSSRNFFLSGVYPVLSAAGAVALVRMSKNPWVMRGLALLVMLVYTYSLASYAFDYYDRYADQSAEGWAKSIKEISRTARKESATHDLVYLGNTAFGDTVQYAFWNGIAPADVQKAWRDTVTEPYGYTPMGNVIFSQKCIDQRDLTRPPLSNATRVFYIASHTCNNEATPSSKIHDFYGNPVWKLFDLDLSDPRSTFAL